jgi:Protein of unknown function (DUF3606)
MQRIKHPPLRNKVDLADPAQIRALTRRLQISSDTLKTVVGRVGNSVAAVAKEIELQQRAQPCPAPKFDAPPGPLAEPLSDEKITASAA